MNAHINNVIAWYIDITPTNMFGLYKYPIIDKASLPLCELHGQKAITALFFAWSYRDVFW
jgi:hypothetical protein